MTATAMPGATQCRLPAGPRAQPATSSPIPAATRTSPTISPPRSTPSRAPNAEIVTGVVLPPDFTTFWNQANQQGFKPKAASIGKAILFPESVEALGDAGNNLSSEVWWSPNHPVQVVAHRRSRRPSSPRPIEATGQASGRSRSASSTRCSRSRSTSMKRADDPTDADALRRGDRGDQPRHDRRPVEWDGANLPPFAAKNVAKTPLVGGQWRLKDDGKYDLVIVDNQTAPEIPGRRQDGADHLIDASRCGKAVGLPPLVRLRSSRGGLAVILRTRAAVARPSARSWSPTASTSPSKPARRSASSARTAPARSTLFNLITGALRPTPARIRLDGQRHHARCRRSARAAPASRARSRSRSPSPT